MLKLFDDSANEVAKYESMCPESKFESLSSENIDTAGTRFGSKTN